MPNTTRLLRKASVNPILGLSTGAYGTLSAAPAALAMALLCYTATGVSAGADLGGPTSSQTGTNVNTYEPTYSGYARVSVGVGASNWTDNSAADPSTWTNTNALSFPSVGGGSQVANYVALIDNTGTTGNLLAFAPATIVGSNGVLTVNTITVSGGTATVTTSSAHGFVAGDTVSVYGTGDTGTSADLNGNKTVLSGGLTSTAFTFTTSASANGSGTMTCWKPLLLVQGVIPQIPATDFIFSAA